MVKNPIINIIPLDDDIIHIENYLCPCMPKVEGNLVIHNAIDGREDFEMEEDNERVH